MSDKFNLPNLALYSKGWYQKENKQTIWEDLKIILTIDGFMGEHMDKSDIVHIILNNCQRINSSAFSLINYTNGITPDNCWKTGYYTKGCAWLSLKEDKEGKAELLPEYDFYEAVIRYCLSNIRFTPNDELGDVKLPKPDYTHGLKRSKGVSKKKLKDFFN